MKIELSAKNYVIADKLEGVLERKLNKLDKYFDDDVDVKVKVLMRQDKEVMTMEITIYAGTVIRSEINSNNMYDNIDALMPKLERQIIKYKTKHSDKQKKNQVREREFFFDKIEEHERKIIRKKEFVLKPMLSDQAIENLELLDHDFYIFLNEHTLEVNVAYKRSDGNYGIIETRKENKSAE